MEASIGEPFLLSSYGVSQRSVKSRKSQQTEADVFATYHKASGSSEGYVTATVRGDGVHVLDLATLHPIISYTLGPTTTFSCPAITRSELQGADRICTTYAAISSSPDLSEEECQKTIWMWKENLSSSIADRAAQKRKAVTLLHTISGLYASDELPTRLLVTSSKGDLTILHKDLQVQTTKSSNAEVLKTFVHSRQACTFLPSRKAPSSGAVVISLLATDDSVRINVQAVDTDDTFTELGEFPLSSSADKICSASCSVSGCFSILMKDGSWDMFELKALNDTSLSLIPASENLRLSPSLAFTSSSQNGEVSILSLGSSHVLLAGIIGSASNREIALLFWDLQFSVLLASRTIPVPANLSEGNVAINPVDSLSSSNVLLLLSPSAAPDWRKSQNKTSTAVTRSTILVLPMTVPPVSSIANAMGRAADGVPWLAKDDGSADGASGSAAYDAGRQKVLEEMHTAMEQNRPQNANTAFLEWEKREAGEVGAKKPDEKGKMRSEPSPELGYNFVKDVLNIMLQPTKPPNIPYSSQVIEHLLDRKVVSAAMVEPGLLAVLRLRNDWKSICLALTNVPDLQEMEIVESLRFVLAKHRQAKSAADPHAMQVDSITPMQDSIPSLPAFLRLCLRRETSLVPLRVALKRYMSDVEDVVCLLQVLDSWMTQWAGRELRLLPSNKMMAKNEHGVLVAKTDQRDDSDIPSMLQITSFLQSLLDTSFINLVQYAPAQQILKKISSQVEPEIQSIDQLEQLRGPLEVFVRAQRKALKEAKAVSEGVKVPVVDWRQRKKLAHEQAGMAIGLYQLEELVL